MQSEVTSPDPWAGGTNVITLKQSNQIINQALNKAREMGLPPLGVAVLDAGGHLRAFQAEDGLSYLRVRVSQAKAWGALGMGIDSAAIAQRYQQGGLQAGFVHGLNALSNGQVIPLPGGVLIRDGQGNVIGAVGVSGAASDDDEICAKSGIKTAGLTTTEDS